jgi:hypothetical protein
VTGRRRLDFAAVVAEFLGEDRLLTTAEAAARLHWSVEKLQAAVTAGLVESVQPFPRAQHRFRVSVIQAAAARDAAR